MAWKSWPLLVYAVIVWMHQHAVISTYQHTGPHDHSGRRVSAAYQQRPGAAEEMPYDDESRVVYGKQNRNLVTATYSAAVVHNNNNNNNQQHANPQRPHKANTSPVDSTLHKRRIWVPAEMVGKYKLASQIQKDEQRGLILVNVCDEGYGPIRWAGTTICRPLCKNCRNGSCESPGLCKCYEGFVRNDNGDCVFTCPLGCLNGKCYLDGTCECDAGYKLDESRKFCRPICSDGCGFKAGHNCTEPEICACSKGYRLEDQGCQPTCQPHCGVGGTCVEHNRCECHPGYEHKDGVCQAKCYQACDNGYCYSPNRCICKPGFTYHEGSTQCVPV